MKLHSAWSQDDRSGLLGSHSVDAHKCSDPKLIHLSLNTLLRNSVSDWIMSLSPILLDPYLTKLA